MRILYITAGAGDMHCGSCTRDLGLVRGLIKRGHDVTLMPLYTPIRDEYLEDISCAPLHYGGINVYLQQLSSIFQRLPNPISRLLDHPGLLRFAAGRGVSTRPSDLAEMTLSVLRGPSGRQARELHKLIEYLRPEPRYDIINLTNSLLSGLAQPLREELGAHIVCTVQGEDGFLEAMGQTHLSEARSLMRRNARFVDLFIATGHSYARSMTEFLGVAPARMRTVLPGIDAARFKNHSSRNRAPFTVGYLSVIHPKKGLDDLVEAVAHAVNRESRQVYLKIGGRILDKRYWALIQGKLRSLHLDNRTEYVGEVPEDRKPEFLHGLSAFCLPTRLNESRGMAVLEAQAAGVPVIVPAKGVFPEMLERTNGGFLVEPDSADSIATTLTSLLDQPDVADAHGIAGAHGVEEHYSQSLCAERAEALYEKVLSGHIRPSNTTVVMRGDQPSGDSSAPS